ncbi:hypothetical protein CISG_03657 [Coccidioides immitis RMSCC 3703]|uniref:Uncharacterized protein n=1 Tax=Coccidioides immitis RMSCC 3703 TaxID=454286 RepID=A0A0J8QM98_COCIT|nr:hypothetical protein CISG_03657 [Coccidioides immitis RMSCC 3703]
MGPLAEALIENVNKSKLRSNGGCHSRQTWHRTLRQAPVMLRTPAYRYQPPKYGSGPEETMGPQNSKPFLLDFRSGVSACCQSLRKEVKRWHLPYGSGRRSVCPYRIACCGNGSQHPNFN